MLESECNAENLLASIKGICVRYMIHESDTSNAYYILTVADNSNEVIRTDTVENYLSALDIVRFRIAQDVL
jgi:hypothetical protein